MIQELEQQSQRIDTLATSLKNANSLNIGLSVISGLFLICLVLLFIKKKGGGSMSKDQFFKFFSFLKNPLWIIVILLIVIIFLLQNISTELTVIGRWMPSTYDIPDYGTELKEIIDKLDDIYWRLR